MKTKIETFIDEKLLSKIEKIENETGIARAKLIRNALDLYEVSPNNYLYVEISARGQGKTYRLIKNAINYLKENDGHGIVIYTDNLSRINYIKNEILKQCPQDSNRIHLATEINDCRGRGNWCRYYFDDFDFLEDLKIDDFNAYGFWKNSYFTTTVKKVRKDLFDKEDFLLFLLKTTKGKYHSYCNPEYLTENLWKAAKSHLSQKDFEKEYLNHWIVI